MQIIGRSIHVISVDRRAIECEHVCRNDQNCDGYSFDISCEHYQEIDSIESSISSTLFGVKIKYESDPLCDGKHQLKLCDEIISCNDGCFLDKPWFKLFITRKIQSKVLSEVKPSEARNVHSWPQMRQFWIRYLRLKMDVHSWPQMRQFWIRHLRPKMDVHSWPQMRQFWIRYLRPKMDVHS